MMIPKDGPFEPAATVAPEVPAANDDAIEGGGKPPGWDPFEVWRTRVRDARARATESRDDSPES